MYTSEVLEICCPECRGALSWREAAPEASPSVDEGLLGCECGQLYPVIEGVPRLLPASRRGRLKGAFPAFFARFPQAAPADALPPSLAPADVCPTACAEVDEARRPAAHEVVAAIGAAMRGARVLDAGCGDGRYARACVEAGAERVVAFAGHSSDVAGAMKNTDAARTLVVEGHAAHPPFEEASFDVVMSAAHFAFAARPERAVTPLLSLLRPGGLFVSYWLAQDEAPRTVARLADQGRVAARMLSGRLPSFARKLVTAAAAPAYAVLSGGAGALSPTGVKGAQATLEALALRGPERHLSRGEAESLASAFGLEEGRAVPAGKGFLVLGRKPVPTPRAIATDAALAALDHPAESSENVAKAASRRNLSILS